MFPASSPPATVSPEQQREYEQLALALLDHAVAELTALACNDPHVLRPRSVDSRKWKAFKKHETVQIYRSRDPSVLTQGLVKIDWTPMAKLLCIGTIVGTVDDAMYGAVTPTELAMATRSRYIKDEFTQHRVLLDMRVPTRDEPFEYLGIKWGARASAIAALVKPRESLYLEATGCREVQIHDGGKERIGFVVYRSVNHPELLKGNGMVHARISACYIFRQADPSTVELYGTMTTDAGGLLPNKLAALAGANVMIAASRVTECALKKKLAWMVSRRSRSFADDGQPTLQGNSTTRCVQCLRTLSAFGSLGECLICQTRVCSRCIASRHLLFGRTKTSIKRKSINMCKSCISTAKHGLNAAEVAADEFAKRRSSRDRLPSTTPSAGVSSNGSSAESYPISARSLSVTESLQEEGIAPILPSTLKIVEVDSGDEKIENIAMPANEQSQTVPPQWSVEQTPQSNQKIELWMRINELRLQAEETYQLAKEQTITMQQAEASRKGSK